MASLKCWARKPRRVYARDGTQCTVIEFFFKLQSKYLTGHTFIVVFVIPSVNVITCKCTHVVSNLNTPNHRHRRVVYLVEKFHYPLRHVSSFSS